MSLEPRICWRVLRANEKMLGKKKMKEFYKNLIKGLNTLGLRENNSDFTLTGLLFQQW